MSNRMGQAIPTPILLQASKRTNTENGMSAFTELVQALDETNKTSGKLEALARFFSSAPDAEKLWMLAVFSGKRPRRILSSGKLRTWAGQYAGIPPWLMATCHGVAGDLAETVSLVLPPPEQPSSQRLDEWMELILSMRTLDDAAKRRTLERVWKQLPSGERFAFHKLLTGGMRLGVSQGLLLRALAAHSGKDPELLAQRIMGAWDPSTLDWHALLEGDWSGSDAGQAYPFFLAHSLEWPEASEAPKLNGSASDWQAEWKWDGIRAQLLRRNGHWGLWSRGEELLSASFPEFALLGEALPEGTVLDGELLAWADQAPLPFGVLQQRLGRKRPNRALLQAYPVTFMAYDVLEWEGQDVRERPLSERQALLGDLVHATGKPKLLKASQALPFQRWSDLLPLRQGGREAGAEGLMLKRKAGPYRVGRPRGDWWKWKLDPLRVDAVLVYAQRGSGRRASLYTDYTFAVRDGDAFLPFAKAYSGLDDAEIRRLDQWIRRHTVGQKGPMRMLEPELVFEIGFEGIWRSDRHKAGVAVRFPRILRWREDKRVQDADDRQRLLALLDAHGPPQPLLSRRRASKPDAATGTLFDAEGRPNPEA
jgi:DNA ligase-1